MGRDGAGYYPSAQGFSDGGEDELDRQVNQLLYRQKCGRRGLPPPHIPPAEPKRPPDRQHFLLWQEFPNPARLETNKIIESACAYIFGPWPLFSSCAHE